MRIQRVFSSTAIAISVTRNMPLYTNKGIPFLVMIKINLAGNFEVEEEVRNPPPPITSQIQVGLTDLQEDAPLEVPHTPQASLQALPSPTGPPSRREVREVPSSNNDWPLGGRLRHFRTEWKEASRWQRNIVSRGIRWRFAAPPPTLKLSSIPPGVYQPGAELLLEKFLKAQVIRECQDPLFLSHVFTVPKADGSLRLILDLSRLNKFLSPPSFFLPSLRSLKEVLPESSWMGKIDLRDAYLHIPVNKDFQRYLAFPWKGKIFCFTSLPFGLSLAPAIFQGMISFPLRLCRAQGIACLGYLDDLILWSASKEECQDHLNVLQSTLRRLGFILNLGKSILQPVQVMTWLGARWDSQTLKIQLPSDKVESIVSLARSLLSSKVTNRPFWEKFLGHLAFAAQISQEMNLQKKLLGPILRTFSGTSETVSLPERTLSVLAWWTVPENLSKWNPLRNPPPSVLLFTDACERGWGAHNSEGQWIAGHWEESSLGLHMNILELRAVLLTLRSYLAPVGSSIRLFSDNSTTVQAIKKQGSSQSMEVTQEVLKIFSLCQQKRLCLDPFKIKGNLNVLADALSRDCTLPGEWELDPLDKEKILSLFPRLEVDLMATPFNSILEKFVSPFLHPQAVAVDAWAINWNQWQEVYCFPPPSQVPKLLDSLALYRGKMTLVLRDHPLLFIPPRLRNSLVKISPLSRPPRQLVRGTWFQDG